MNQKTATIVFASVAALSAVTGVLAYKTKHENILIGSIAAFGASAFGLEGMRHRHEMNRIEQEGIAKIDALSADREPK